MSDETDGCILARMRLMEKIQRRLVGIASHLCGLNGSAVDSASRGFVPIGEHAEHKRRQIGIAFISGFDLALSCENMDQLLASLDEASLEFRGFTYEGAAMAMSLLDSLPFGSKQRHQQFLNSQESRYPYTTHVGSGWALARTLWKRRLMKAQRDPLLGWLMLDGFGFHQAYFHWRKLERDGTWFPRGLTPAQQHVFMQGVGRCLWFIEGGLAEGIAAHVRRFSRGFHGDLWSGVALAAVYAGGAEVSELQGLHEPAGEFRAELAQGAAFAAKACVQGGFVSRSASEACQVLCGCSATEAATITDLTLRQLDTSASESYAKWRELVQEHFSRAAVAVAP